MASLGGWRISTAAQPRPQDYDYDLDRALSSVVGLRTNVPADAFTAETLGTERGGNAVVIAEGVLLTIGYLIMEAEAVWLTTSEGVVLPGHAAGYDQETGFGLVQALGRLNLPALPLGRSAAAQVGESVVVGGAGGRQRSVAARIVAKHEFAGNWEYVLEDAIFTAPPHPNWGGTALIGPGGDLLGIGSLQIQQASEADPGDAINMMVPIDIGRPVLDDLLSLGRPNRPPRPWLGVYATEIEDKVVIAGVAARGPAARADVRTGDIVLAVAGNEVTALAPLFRSVWSLGRAGVEVPLLVYRDGKTFEVRITSGDRHRYLKGPSLH